MNLASTQEFIVGQALVRVYAAPIALPGVEGWVGVWSIYQLPLEIFREPIRIGSTDVQESEAVALGMARAIATAVAASI
jgi:hypothetical protein